MKTGAAEIPVADESLTAGVVEDQPQIALAIADLLRPYYGAVHVWHSGEAVLSAPELGSVALYCVDLGLPGMSGLDLIRALALGHRPPLILVISSLVTEDVIVQALTEGAMGFVSKDELERLPAAVATLQSGGAVATSSVMLRLLEKFRKVRGNETELLSARERQVAELYIQGLDRKKIAEMFQTSENTVKNQVASIYKKLQATNRLDLARRLGRI